MRNPTDNRCFLTGVRTSAEAPTPYSDRNGIRAGLRVWESSDVVVYWPGSLNRYILPTSVDRRADEGGKWEVTGNRGRSRLWVDARFLTVLVKVVVLCVSWELVVPP